MFFDEAKIHVKAGKGGNGCVAFRREKGVPFGGPSGGNGGKGGNIVLCAKARLNTLINFYHQNFFAADPGKNGQGKDMAGRSGKTLVINVPCGTVVRDADTGRVLGDLLDDGQQVCVVRGGRGGRGNMVFATSTNQAPRISERGEPGEEGWLALELKLIADVGLVGMPNAGKSTLLSVVSGARPKIAAYPFTTLQPNLGVVALDFDTRFVMADLPGLIEGASRGTGLGYQFLRHVERTRLLVHIIDGLAHDPLDSYDVINRELETFSQRLAAKPQFVVVSKMDVPEARETWPLIQEALAERGIDALAISAVTKEGTQNLLWEISRRLEELPVEILVEEVEPEPEIDAKAFTVAADEQGWHIHGVAIERAALMANWDQYESQARFHRIMEALGITMVMREAGVQEGDTVFIGDVELQWGWR